MKNHEEMYQSLLSRYDEYQEKKKQRIIVTRRIVSLAACFTVIFSGYKIWSKIPKMPIQPPIIDNPSSENTSETTSDSSTPSLDTTESNTQSSIQITTSDETKIPQTTNPSEINSNTQSKLITTHQSTESYQTKPVETQVTTIATVPQHTEIRPTIVTDTPQTETHLTTQIQPIETKPSNTDSQNPTTVITQPVTEPTTTSPIIINIEVPPNTHSYLFDSYSELSEALDKQDSVFSEDSGDYGQLFSKMLSLFENNKFDLYIPAINGEECALRNKEGFSNISLMTSELYYIPWIWYHCKYNNNDIDIKISYPSVLESSELNSAKTYYEVLKMIAPSAPNPDNYTEFESYQNIYEADINLANDKKVVAMISEIKDSSKVYVMFIYDGILVSIYTDNDNLSEEFWNSFSLAEY